MFGDFKEEARKVLVLAKQEMYELKHPYVGSEHLLLAILKNDSDITKRLNKYDLNYEKFKKEIINTIGIGSKESEWFLYTPLLKRVIENAIIDSKENNNGEVTTEHLVSSLLEEGEGVALRILLALNIDIDALYNEFNNKLYNSKKKKNKKLVLDELGTDLTAKAQNNELDPVIGRSKEIQRVLEILSRRTKNNPLLIGEAGVGKTAIVEELSRLIVAGDVPLNLRNKRIISLDMASAVAGTKYRGEFEERVRKILKEVEENDDIILFIDEIHTLVGAGGAEGAIDASNIFKPALARNKLRCIGATTTTEYKKYIEEDKALERRFQKVTVEVPNEETVKEILMKLKAIYEKFHLVKIEDSLIDKIISLSERYIYDRNQPDKSIDVLDEVCAKASLKENENLKEYNSLTKKLNQIIKDKNKALVNNDFKEAYAHKNDEFSIMDQINNLELKILEADVKEVTILDIAEVIATKTKIPVYEILNETTDSITKIKTNLTEEILGQEEAIDQVVNIIRRIKLGYKDDNKCYSILFQGPSGVGKTILAKKFGVHLVNQNNVIKLDMSEFSEAHSISKILGAPPGYVGFDSNSYLLDEIRSKPYAVLILDEIEKASSAIINLLFQILDDGKIKDSKGNEVRFDNVVIIMTSNIGFNEANIGFKKLGKEELIAKLKDYFPIPFINRIDNIVTFNNMSSNIIEAIIAQKLNILKEKYQKKSIEFNYDKKIISEICQLTNFQEFGARKVEKIIKDKVENTIIDNILKENHQIKIETINEKITS